MDLAAIIGLLMAVISLVAAFAIEGGGLGMLLVLTAFMIVFGGTIGVTIISFPWSDLKRVPYFFKKVFTDQTPYYHDTLESLVFFADVARREGLLSLENQLELVDNRFLRRGLQLIIDGTPAEVVRNIMRLEIESFETSEKVGQDIFTVAGGYAPTMGIIGTVMGMISVLSNLSNPDELGPAIAVAFLATLYGIASANILWIPFGTKIKIKTEKEIYFREMILEGVLSIQVGENPRLLREKLSIYIPPDAQKRLEEGKKGGEQ
jgi:chemotaxis protein MotA